MVWETTHGLVCICLCDLIMHHSPLCSSHGFLYSPVLSGWKIPYSVNIYASFSQSSSVTLLKRLPISPDKFKALFISFCNMVYLSFTDAILHQFGTFIWFMSVSLNEICASYLFCPLLYPARSMNSAWSIGSLKICCMDEWMDEWRIKTAQVKCLCNLEEEGGKENNISYHLQYACG